MAIEQLMIQVRGALLRRAQVQEICAIGRTKLWNDVRDGTFPAPIATGARGRAWRSEDIQRYLDKLTPAVAVTKKRSDAPRGGGAQAQHAAAI